MKMLWQAGVVGRDWRGARLEEEKRSIANQPRVLNGGLEVTT